MAGLLVTQTSFKDLNFNSDGPVNSSDAAILAGNFGLDNSQQAVTARDWQAPISLHVPEPCFGGLMIGLLGALPWLRARPKPNIDAMSAIPSYRVASDCLNRTASLR